MKEKMLIRYVRKSKTIMVPTKVAKSSDLYSKEKVYYPCGVLICVCRDEHLYFGWSYISNMARESVPVGQGFSKVPSFVKKTAIKIAMDKINSRTTLWSKADMPIAIRREFDSFVARATKYFKTQLLGNVDPILNVVEERSVDGESTNAISG